MGNKCKATILRKIGKRRRSYLDIAESLSCRYKSEKQQNEMVIMAVLVRII
jgi:hypothetical protein